MNSGELSPRSVRVLLFDLGGVVFAFDFGRAFKRWSQSCGRTAAELEREFSFDDAYERHERGEIDAAEYLTSLRNTLKADLSESEFVAGWNAIYLEAISGISTMLGAASKHFPLYAFTNSNPTHQQAWSKMFERELAYFKKVFVSSELGRRKPEREAFLDVSRQIGATPNEVLFFDDTSANVDGAISAGMQGVVVRTPEDVGRALAWLGVDLEPPGPRTN